MKKYVVLKSSYNKLYGLDLYVFRMCNTYIQAQEELAKQKAIYEKCGCVVAETNLALSMYNPLNDMEYFNFEIQEIEVE